VTSGPGHGEPKRSGAFARRTLLKKGLLGAPILLLGAALPIGMRSGVIKRWPKNRDKSQGPGGAAAAFTPYEHAIFAAAAARLVPGDDAVAAGWPSADALDCAGKVDALVARLHPRAISEMRQLLRLFENGLSGLFATGMPVTFTRCSALEQDARLEAWRRSRLSLLRSGYQAMKRLAHAVYYSSPEIYARVGYPGPPVVPQAPT
jgi:hypothetical protein